MKNAFPYLLAAGAVTLYPVYRRRKIMGRKQFWTDVGFTLGSTIVASVILSAGSVNMMSGVKQIGGRL